MAGFGPSLPLGEHLEELRWRLVRVVVGVMVLFFIAFLFNSELKELVVQPLRWALELIGADQRGLLGLPDPDQQRLLRADGLAEPAITSMQVSFYAAVAVAVPHIIWELWAFVAPGLKSDERKLGFLFVPGAVLFFYGGALLGYFWGLPYFYGFLIDYSAADPIVYQEFRQSEYLRFFVVMTLAFGAIMDIPWAVMVAIRVGLVTPAKLARARKLVIAGSAVLAAMLTPPDPISQLALLIPMVVLFEVGLLGGRVLYRQRLRRRLP